jgi:hypothetical protein
MRHPAHCSIFAACDKRHNTNPLRRGFLMAEHTHSGPLELGAPMDYEAHRSTFAAFVALTKVTALGAVAVVQALALFGLANNAFWLGVLMIVLVMAASAIAIIGKGNIKPLIGVVVLGFILMALTLG